MLLLCALFAVLCAGAPSRLPKQAWRRPTASMHASSSSSSASTLLESTAATGVNIEGIHSDLLRMNRNSNYNEIVSYHDELVSRHNKCISNVLNYSDAQGRISINIVLDALLHSRQRDVAEGIIDSLTDRRVKVSRLSLDTAHIMLKDMTLRRGEPAATDGLFSWLFGPGNGSYLRPSARTLNILVEALRCADEPERAWKYYNLLTGPFGVLPDMYTYSSLVKIAESADVILGIVHRAALQKGYATPPLVRCAVESAGKLGDPSLACFLASRYLVGNDSVHRCADSGDSLMVALLHGPTTKLDFKSLYAASNPTLQDDVFARRLSGQRCSDAVMSLLEYGTAGSAEDGIALSSKGYCLLFTYQQRRLRDLVAQLTGARPPSQSSFRTLSGERDELKAFVGFGWSRYLFTVSTSNNRLNGRICDAYLRCFVDDAERAKQTWKRVILPLAMQLLGDGGPFDEVAEKSLQALMFVFGSTGRADLGLEVAVTVRKRGWAAGSRQQLAANYLSGKYGRSRPQDQSTGANTGAGALGGLGSLVAGAFESSIESELGFPVSQPSGDTRPRWPKIRLQFNASQPQGSK